MATRACDAGRPWLVTADVRGAFDWVPHGPLLRQVRLLAGPEVERLVRGVLHGRRRGIPQGSPLSGMLLNVLLCDLFDERWTATTDNVVTVRWADDLFAACPNRETADLLWQRASQLLHPLGLQLKGSPELTSPMAGLNPWTGWDGRSNERRAN